MKKQTSHWLLSFSFLFVVGQHSNAHALTADEVLVKKAIADTMTPEELAAYKARVAANFSRLPPRPPVIANTPADICTAATYEIGPLTYGPITDTTVGATDNYDLPGDITDPTCTAASSCTGGGPPGSLPRGAIYTGTGTAPDRAWRIRTDANCNLMITMDPTSTQDLVLIVYQATCSSSLANCACVDDTGDVGVAESVTLSAVAGTDYFVVVDGYSINAPSPGPSGPYTLTVTGTGCALVPVELQQFSVE
jgi:hypothetical protein